MTLSAQRLKQIDGETKHLVFGYCRLVQSVLNGHDASLISSTTIPDLVVHACLAFYHEYHVWDYSTDASCMTVTNDSKSIKYQSTANGFRTCYAKHWLTFGDHCNSVIRIKIDQSGEDRYWGIIIGIVCEDSITPKDSTDTGSCKSYFADNHDTYAYESNGRPYDSVSAVSPFERNNIGSGFQANDILTLIIRNQQLYFEVNSQLQWQVTVAKTDLKYKLAVSMTNGNDGITLL